MRTSEFNKIVNTRLKSAREILVHKGAGYNPSHDRFRSFNAVAKIKQTSAIKALEGMWLKHISDILSTIDQMEADYSFVPTEKWVTDKLGDNINYSLLAEGLIEERRNMLKEAK